MKYLLLILFVPMLASSQVSIQAGYKTVQVGYEFRNEEFLNFGFAFSAVDGELAGKRATTNDRKVHDFHSDVVPAVFGLIGATFDELTITGKLGGAYLEQSINGVPESQKFYPTIGVQFEYKGATASYDNVNAVLIGYTFKFN